MNTYEKVFQEQYQRLNPEQKKAVDTLEGPVFVMAGPGTGKTQILTLRIANILKEISGIEPENILALTFTNAAAYNMRERLATIVGSELAHRVTLTTFHSFAEDIIKKYSEYFPSFFNARIISPVEQVELLDEILANMDDLVYFSKFKRRDGTVKGIISAIGAIKNEGLNPDAYVDVIQKKFEEKKDEPKMFYQRKFREFQKGDRKPGEMKKLEQWKEKSLELVEIYRRYQEALQKRKLYDFSDLILSLVFTLENNKEFQSEIQEQYHYILVDEHQDTNEAQNRILYALIDNPVWEQKPNIFVVGDSKQAIFRFAGASEQSYTAFLEKLRDVQMISLKHNYRSHQNILNTSHSLITKSDYHNDEEVLEAFFNEGGVLQYRRFQNYKMELLYVAQEIRDAVQQGKNPSEIAVLYRNNSDGEDIAHLLSVYGVPVRDFSKKNILKDRDMLKIFLLLRSVYDVSDNEILAKSLFIDFLHFDVFAVQLVIQSLRSAKLEKYRSLYNVLRDKERLMHIGVDKDTIEKFLAYADFLARAKIFSENNDFIQFFSWFLRESGFLSYILQQADSSIGIAKIEKLFDEIKKESLARQHFEFSDFIRYLDTLKKHHIAMNITNTLSEGVQLMTFHGSKGLEFERVYIIKALQKKKQGLEIPLAFDNFHHGDIDDERRLFYVAMTRAKHECFISSHIFNAEGKEQNESVFIDDIEGLERIDVSAWEKEHYQDIVDVFGEGHEHITSLLDVSYIQQLFKKKQLSVSALNNYIESPLKYFFRNLVALPEARSHFLDFGNLMHETLEHYFNLCKKEQRILDTETLKKSFEYIIQSRPYYEEFRERAWGTLEAYHHHYYPDFELPLENELHVRAIPFDIGNDEHILLSGVLDKVTKQDDGSIVVWDYKTGKAYSDMDTKRKDKIKRQAVFYKMLLDHAFDGRYRFCYAIFDFLEKNKKGEYEQQRFEITQSDVDELKQDIMRLVRDIQEGTLLDYDFSKDNTNAELLEFLEVMRGPVVQKKLFEE